MLNSQSNEKGILKSLINYPEFVLYIGIAMSFILGSIFFLFHRFFMNHLIENQEIQRYDSGFANDILLQALLYLVPISAIIYMFFLSKNIKNRQNFGFDWGLPLWIAGLCLILISSYHFQSAFHNAQALPTIILLLGTSVLLMIPWVSLKADIKFRRIGLLLSWVPFVVFLLFFNLVEYPFRDNSFPLWGSLYVLSAIVSIILALLAWRVRKNIENQSVEDLGETDIHIIKKY